MGPYYPKLQVECPVTPTSGPRMLVGSDPGKTERRTALIAALQKTVVAEKLSSLHFSFATQAEWLELKRQGFLCDVGLRFAWMNAGYTPSRISSGI